VKRNQQTRLDEIFSFVLKSISQTFYSRIFCQYFGAKNYTAETLGFETFWQKDIGKKFSRKMLIKLN